MQSVVRHLDLHKKAHQIFFLPNGCVEFTGAHNGNGYHVVNIDKRRVPAHREFYKLLVGDIPPGLVIDHLCRNTSCVNPKHLEPVSIGENVLRGVAPSSENKRKDKCPRCGGEYSGERGGRRCLPCVNERLRAKYKTDAEYREKMKARANAYYRGQP